MDILRQTACIVVNAILVDNFASLQLHDRGSVLRLNEVSLPPQPVSDDYQCLWSGTSWSCLWFTFFSGWIQIAIELFALFRHSVFDYICVSLWCFTDEVENPYADRI